VAVRKFRVDVDADSGFDIGGNSARLCIIESKQRYCSFTVFNLLVRQLKSDVNYSSYCNGSWFRF
jgi:hypothetical protein